MLGRLVRPGGPRDGPCVVVKQVDAVFRLHLPPTSFGATKLGNIAWLCIDGLFLVPHTLLSGPREFRAGAPLR